MNVSWRKRVAFGALGVALFWSFAVAAQTIQRSPETDRVNRIVAAMSLDEKIAMVNGSFGATFLKDHPDEKRNGAGHVPGVPRLGIPDLFESDSSLGVANDGEMRKGDVATALPSSLATAASFDPAIAFAGGAMIGAEARAKGFNVLLAGGANLTRDPWAGRNFEYLSEDPLLTGLIAGASVMGIQSNRIVSTVKHFALNAQESGRTVLDARLADAAFRESDLLAFEISIEHGRPGSVMCGYNRVNGEYACENAFLLNDVLKRDWRYPGWVMSDWGAVHSTVKAAAAGLDQESGRELDAQAFYQASGRKADAQAFFGAPLKAAVESGAVSRSRLDDMVARIVGAMARVGLLDDPTPLTPQAIDYEAHAAVAQEAAEAGIVLLRNEGELLPLAGTANRILIVGAHADIGVLSGGGASQVQAVGGNPIQLPLPGGGPLSSLLKISYHGSSPLAAIRARAPRASISYVDGTDPAVAATRARAADIVLVFAGQWRAEGIDVETLSLPDGQDALIEAIAAANPKTAVILETGGAVLMPWLDKVGAVLEAWYPGQRGGPAIASVLFGDVNPSGRLPLTFPASGAQAPRPQIPGLALVHAALKAYKPQPVTDLSAVDMTGGLPPFAVEYPEGADVGYRWYERKGDKPLFPFGFGLSYTRFSYTDLKVSGGRTATIAFTIKNVGSKRGADVPQAYAKVGLGSGPALSRLVGFRRLMLNPGESRRITMAIDPRLLASFDTTRRGWHVIGGAIPIAIGTDARTPILTAAMPMTETFVPVGSTGAK